MENNLTENVKLYIVCECVKQYICDVAELKVSINFRGNVWPFVTLNESIFNIGNRSSASSLCTIHAHTEKEGGRARGMTIKYTSAHTICATNESTFNDDDDVVNSLACRSIRNICGQNEIIYFDYRSMDLIFNQCKQQQL